MFSYFCYKKNVIKPITLYYDNTFFAYYFNVVIKPYTVTASAIISTWKFDTVAFLAERNETNTTQYA